MITYDPTIKTRKDNMSKKNKNTTTKNHNAHHIKHGQDNSIIFSLKSIIPKTKNQEKTFEAYASGKNLLLHGSAGTGKTFLSIYLALKEILSGQSPYDKIVLIRSVVPSREIGFLPGNISEKSRIYEEPYYDLCDKLFDSFGGYEALKLKGFLQFETTSFLRGTTFERCIIIADEIQNMPFQEINTVITRAGENCRVIFVGDARQSDLEKDSDRYGFFAFEKIVDKMPSFATIEFDTEDIVRSGLVKEFIIAAKEFFHGRSASGNTNSPFIGFTATEL